VTDGPPALALGVDPADEGSMRQRPRPAGEGVLTPQMWSGIIFRGDYRDGHPVRTRRVIARRPGGGGGHSASCPDHGFTTLMLFQVFNVINARSDDRSAFHHLFTNG
jgi:Ca2+-transporting ATPase